MNYKELSPELAATLVFGLSDNSRVKRKLSNQKLTIEQTLLAMIIDNLNYICWTYSSEAQKGRSYNKRSVLSILEGEESGEELMSFATPEEYNAYMNSLRGL